MTRRSACVLGLLALLAATPARASDWPNRTVTVVAPYAAGGFTDILARLGSKYLSEKFNQPFVIENRLGAGGSIGATYVANAAPDGYTLLFGSASQFGVSPFIQKVGYGLDSFAPASVFGTIPFLLGIKASVPAKTVPEFVAYAKANPGKLNYATAGSGATSHLLGAGFGARAGIDIVHVPFKGASEVYNAILGGQVQMYFGDIGGMLPLIREKRLKALALSGATRVRELPRLPTMMESGVPDYQVSTFIGVMAPAGTPPAVVTRLSRAINHSLETPEVIAIAVNLNADLTPLSPEAFGAFLRQEYDKWSEVTRSAGIKIE